MDPAELDRIEERLDLIFRLKRKYGGSVEEILAFKERAQQELDSIVHAEELQAKLEKEHGQSEARLIKLAKQLSEKRKSAAKQFEDQVCAELTFLDMPSVRFIVHAETGELDETGIDRMEPRRTAETHWKNCFRRRTVPDNAQPQKRNCRGRSGRNTDF